MNERKMYRGMGRAMDVTAGVLIGALTCCIVTSCYQFEGAARRIVVSPTDDTPTAPSDWPWIYTERRDAGAEGRVKP